MIWMILLHKPTLLMLGIDFFNEANVPYSNTDDFDKTDKCRRFLVAKPMIPTKPTETKKTSKSYASYKQNR